MDINGKTLCIVSPDDLKAVIKECIAEVIATMPIQAEQKPRINGNEELAAYLNVSVSRLYDLLKQGYFAEARLKRSPRLVAYDPKLVDKEMKRLAKL